MQRAPDIFAKRNGLRAAFALALLPLLAAGQGSPTVLTVKPVADAEIREVDIGPLHSGTDTIMTAGTLGLNAGNAVRRAVLRFDVSQIPPGAEVVSANVRVQVIFKIPAGPANSAFGLRRILKPWVETEVTWAEAATGVTWQIPGASGNEDSIATPSSTVFITGLGGYTFPTSAQLVADVQGWVNNPAANFGWLLRSQAEATAKTARHFGTRENVSAAPVLTVTYRVAPPRIVTGLTNLTVFETETATFRIEAGGVQPITYQWQFNGVDLPSETNTFLTLPGVTTNQAGTYNVIVSNAVGATNSSATLNVVPFDALRPRVTFTSPNAGERFPANANVQVSGSVTTSNATLADLTIKTNGTTYFQQQSSQFSFVLSNLPPGDFTVEAIATDSANRLASASVNFTVVAPPVIWISSPADGAAFVVGSNVTISATAPPDQLTNLVRVQFFVDGASIGESTSPPFAANWSPPGSGQFVIHAVATDDLGQTGASSNVTIRAYNFEQNAPKISLTNAPANFSRTRSPAIFLAGTASDDQGILRAEVSVNGGAFNAVSGTTTWNTNLPLVAGFNTIRVRAVDVAFNTSRTIERYCTFVVMDGSLSVTAMPPGGGIVSPRSQNGLEIGSRVRLSAKSASGFLFAGWTNNFGIGQLKPVFDLTMSSNEVWTAHFVTNIYLQSAGEYAGLAVNATNPAPIGNGLLNIKLSKSGQFTAKLKLEGASYSVKSFLDAFGNGHAAIIRPGSKPIAMNLSVTGVPGDEAISGYLLGDDWFSFIQAYRNPFASRRESSPHAGSYFFSITPDSTNAPALSAGLQISNQGRAIIAAMPGGRRAIASSSASRQGYVPFYLLTGEDTYLGWLNAGNLSGSYGWWISRDTNVSPASLQFHQP